MDPYIEIALQAVMVALDTEKSDAEKKEALEILTKKKTELDEKYSDLISQKKYLDNIQELEKKVSDFIKGK